MSCLFRSKSLYFGILLVPCTLLAQPKTPETLTLAKEREKLVMPKITTEDKALFLDQAKIFLQDLYVHRYDKSDYYLGHQDPGEEIDALISKSNTLSPEATDQAIRAIFNKQRDLHLDYHFPYPQKQYIGFLPLTFTKTTSETCPFEVRVSAVQKDFFQQFAPTQCVPAIGDRLVAYNGQPLYQVLHGFKPTVQGANTYGWFACAVNNLTWRHFKRKAVPQEDAVTLTFCRHQPEEMRGATYSITLPWLLQKDPTMRGATARFTKPLHMGINEDQEDYNRFVRDMGLETPSLFPQNPTKDKELTWGLIDHPNGRFAYIRLNSFVPQTNADTVLAEVQRLLKEEMQNTDGLIFDIRNNPGGEIAIADALLQYFTKVDAQPLKFRLLNTALNHRIFTESKLATMEPRFKKLMDAAKGSNHTFTDSLEFTPIANANTVGQLYYKPVAVLANARTYSSGDMFTCGMQDNRAALIFGEDPQTGAGGANVVEHRGFFCEHCKDTPLKDVFKPLPDNRDMRVSWRQTLRVGDHAEELIEDRGCQADVDIAPTVEDLLSGGASQLDTITERLREQATEHSACVRTDNQDFQIMLPKEAPFFTLYTQHTHQVQVIVNGEVKAHLDAGGENDTCTLPIDMVPYLGFNLPKQVTFVGLDESGEPCWRTKRQMAINDTTVLVPQEGVTLNFTQSQTLAPWVIFNQATEDKNGWQLEKPYMQVGYHPQYAEFTNTDAALRINLQKLAKPSLEWRMEYDTEKDWDFIEVFATCGKQTKMVRYSGKAPMDRYTLDLAEFGGKDNVSLHFRMTSDSNTNATGVRVQEIRIK